MLKKIYLGSGLAALLPALASAQSPVLPPAPAQNAPDLITRVICPVLGWVFVLLILLAVVFVIVSAFRYLTAAGDPEKVKKANYTLLYAAIAVAVAILAKAVPLIVASLVGNTAITLYC